MKAPLLRMLQDWRAQKHPCAMVTHLPSGASALVGGRMRLGELDLTEAQLLAVRAQIASDRSAVMEGDLFVRVYAPPLRLIVIGAVHIAKALAPIATLAGFEVSIVDPREGFVRSEQMAGVTAMVAWPDEALSELQPDGRTAIVTLTHDPKLDDPALTSALRSSAFYIGALGSRKTHASRIARLRESGFSDEEVSRIHGPVGLDINALSPAEIAVSIVAQVIAVLRAEAA